MFDATALLDDDWSGARPLSTTRADAIAAVCKDFEVDVCKTGQTAPPPWATGTRRRAARSTPLRPALVGELRQGRPPYYRSMGFAGESRLTIIQETAGHRTRRLDDGPSASYLADGGRHAMAETVTMPGRRATRACASTCSKDGLTRCGPAASAVAPSGRAGWECCTGIVHITELSEVRQLAEQPSRLGRARRCWSARLKPTTPRQQRLHVPVHVTMQHFSLEQIPIGMSVERWLALFA